MTWPHESPPPPPDIPNHGSELETLNAFLDYYRSALVDRAWGLTHAQLQIALPPSTLTLSRLIGHMAGVEYWWFADRFAGAEPDPVATSLDWDADPDAEMTYAQTLSIEELLAWFNRACDDSRGRVAAAGSLDQLSSRPHPRHGHHWNLRWILVHMIEEYARHCGHADLIRESIDGSTVD
ncbi:MAG: DinB family protein [Acidimicrobiia bacterium]|nr:DinB family protein [Acidimicrobiia bacterium]